MAANQTFSIFAAFVFWEGEPGISIRTWVWPPFIILPIVALALCYAIGIVRIKARTARSSWGWWPTICFATGCLCLVFALDSPIHELSEHLFWVHMTQHEILMLMAAPLLVLGRPTAPLLWALSPPWRKKFGSILGSGLVSGLWAGISNPFSAWTLHAAALWLWHMPVLFDAAVNNETVHAAQHISFLGSALLFWSALFHQRAASGSSGISVLYAFTTAIHTSLLGALLTFSRFSWYRAYATTTTAWNLTPLEDQQLGGLIMWIPAGVILFVITLVLFARWLAESDIRWKLNHSGAFAASVKESSDAS